jgi:hypothetical protein
VTRRGPKGASVIEARLDGAPVPVPEGEARIPLRQDGAGHDLEVILGQREDKPS